ncbi:MAG: hypothetical protein EAX96_18550 [Candidatus Lokiarchaeota archaeon]|nr:hypothetical protein [Candidatus Lokiarchaeota archaeon]
MNKEDFLPIWIKFSGWLEIIFGLMITFFMAPVFINFGVQTIPFWTQFAGISLVFMGILLLYSARDIKVYLIIPIVSSLYRFTMVIAEIIFVITYFTVSASLVFPILFALFYDAGSATFTLWILYDLDFLKK